jgi:hypothetical protein
MRNAGWSYSGEESWEAVPWSVDFDVDSLLEERDFKTRNQKQGAPGWGLVQKRRARSEGDAGGALRMRLPAIPHFTIQSAHQTHQRRTFLQSVLTLQSNAPVSSCVHHEVI